MIKGKVEICEIKLSNFDNIQGFEGFPLYAKARYAAISSIIKRVISKEYQHFLAQPFELDDKLIWYATPYVDEPRKLTELTGDSEEKYQKIKKETISHYEESISNLKANGKIDDSEYLRKSLRFIDDEFIYCYDNKVVLCVWGMKPSQSKNLSSGEYITELYDETNEIKRYSVRFEAGSKGVINDTDNIEFEIKENELFDKSNLPKVSANDGFKFRGWSKSQLDKLDSPIQEDIIVNALYDDLNDINDDTNDHLVDEEEEREDDQDQTEEAPLYHSVVFQFYKDGVLDREEEIKRPKGHQLNKGDYPEKESIKGYTFKNWDKEPVGTIVDNNLYFKANYEKDLPWYKKAWNFLWTRGCLMWLLRVLILLVIIWLIMYLWKECQHNTVIHDSNNRDNITDSLNAERYHHKDYINEDQWISDENGTDHGRYIKDPETKLPRTPRVIIPFERDDVINSEDGYTKIVSGRLNGLIDKDKSIYEFAKKFDKDYPSSEFEIIYFDTLVNRVQFSFPETEREAFKSSLKSNYDEFGLYVWDESLFEQNSIKDPDYQIASKRWYLDAINVEKAWSVTKGSEDVIVAVVDGGFDLNHVEFQGKVVRPYNVSTRSSKVSKSKNSHGTHVAGIAIANSNDKGLLGVAPGCSFMPVQVSKRSKYIAISSVLDGLLYAMYQGADVINLSITLSLNEKAVGITENQQRQLIQNYFKEEERLWDRVFEIADREKCVIVAAAGNQEILAGIDPIHRANSVVTVSAVSKNSQGIYKSKFSNYGKYSTLSAPGSDIYSSISNNRFGLMDGTSMAAPIVTGAIALLKSTNKDLTNNQVKEKLIQASERISPDIGPMINLENLFSNSANANSNPEKECVECEKLQRQIDSLKSLLKEKRKN